jgi:hypothetical protein
MYLKEPAGSSFENSHVVHSPNREHETRMVLSKHLKPSGILNVEAPACCSVVAHALIELGCSGIRENSPWRPNSYESGDLFMRANQNEPLCRGS